MKYRHKCNLDLILQSFCDNISGIYTGSVYNDPTLKKHGFPAEHKMDKTVVAIKTHSENSKKDHLKYERAIIIMRYPYESLLAEFNRQKGHGQTRSANPKTFESKSELRV